MIRPILTLIAAEVTAALSGQRSPTVTWARGFLSALQIDMPPITVRDVCGDAPAQCEAPTEQDRFPLWLKVALGFAKPRCAGCGEVVETVLCGNEGEDGSTRVDEVTVGCINERCKRLTETIEFVDGATMEEGAMVGKLRPVVMGPSS